MHLEAGPIEIPEALLSLAERFTPSHDIETVSSLVPYSDVIERGWKTRGRGQDSYPGRYPGKRALDLGGERAVNVAFDTEFGYGLESFDIDRAFHGAAEGIAIAYIHQVEIVDAVQSGRFRDTIDARVGGF
ncbi:MAG TPA: hypothetical protein VF708_19980 [Pyrinomonadaceae bacterium]|jgi:hypothetical protein